MATEARVRRLGAHLGAIAASVIVLGYHQFTGPGQSSKNIYVMRQDVFDQEMKYLRDNGYHVVHVKPAEPAASLAH